MVIETKFTPGDKVWAIYNNKVQEFTVESVKVTASYNYAKDETYTPFAKYLKFAA